MNARSRQAPRGHASPDELTWLARIPEQNPDLVLRVDREGRVLYLNASAREEYEGELEVGSLVDGELLAVVTGALVHGTFQQAELAHGDRWFCINAKPDGDAANVYARDVTERKRAEEVQRRLLADVQAEKDKLTALIASVRDEVWFTDLDRNITLANPPAAREFELDGGAIEVRDFAARLEVLRPDGSPRPIDEAPLLRGLRGEVVVGQEEVIRTPASSELRWREVSGAPVRNAAGAVIGAMCVVRDITERKRIEDALRESEARVRSVIGNLPQTVIYQVETPDDGGRRFSYLSGAVSELFGCTPEEAMADAGRIYGAIVDEDRERVARLEAVALRRFTPFKAEIRVRTAPGCVRWIYATSAPRRRDDIVVWDGVIVDIGERKETERALAESEERYRTLIELAPDAVVVHRDRKIIFANPAALQLYGAESPEQLLGKDIVELVHPDDRESTSERIDRAQSGARTPLREFRTLRLDGSEIHTEAIGVGIQYQGRPAVQVIVRDITQRRRTEVELRRTQEEYRHIVEGSGSVILRADKDTRITYMNRYGLRFFGYARDELIGRRALGTIVPETDEAGRDIAAMMEDMMRHPGRYRTNVHQNRCRDGRLVWMSWANTPIFDDQGQLLEFLAIGNDVTRLKEAEQELQRRQEELRQSEERFRSLAQALPQIVFDIDPKSMTGYFNDRWAEYTGRRPGAFEDRVELLHPDDRARMARCWNEALRSGGRYECEYRFRRHDGEYRWFLGRGVPIRGAGGEPTRWLGTVTDIHELKQKQEALHEADRAKNEFLAVLSHELRNPLAPIKNSLYILDHAVPGGDQARRAYAIVVRQVDQLARLVDDLLEMTRITRNKIHLQRQRLELNALVRHTMEDYRPTFEKAAVRLDFEPAPGPVHVDADWNRIAQVVGNLLANAAKFTPPNGRVHVAVASDAAADRAVVRVSDTGVGLTPELASRVFEPFMQADTTLDRSKGGLGLGLALVKALVELHGGEVAASSPGPGQGSEFTFRLPLDRSEPAAMLGERVLADAPRRRVLVVEDNVDAADSLRELLELHGHEVAVAYNGIDGIARAREFHPDLLFCDIGLPVMDGYAVARAFRADEELRNVHLVALSGYALPDDLQRSADAGFERHLAKPPGLDELAEVLGDTPRPR